MGMMIKQGDLVRDLEPNDPAQLTDPALSCLVLS